MPTITFTISEKVHEQRRKKARARGLSVSDMVAEPVEHEISKDNCSEGFFKSVTGRWQGPVPEIEDFELQERDELL